MLVALTVPTLWPAFANGPVRILQPERCHSRSLVLSASVAAAAATMHGPVTVCSAAAAAEGGFAVADALRADGVVRINGIITPTMSTDLLGCIDESLAAALHETREHEEFGEEWHARFGDIMKPCHRHDVKLGLVSPPVREALSMLLGALQPALTARLGAGAQLHELAALVSLPGAARQPVHPDTPMSFFEGVGEGEGTYQAGEGEGQGGQNEQREQRPSIVTAFCALQDIGAEMGPTLFLPRTHTAAAHAKFYTYENFDLAFSSVDEEEGEVEDDETAARVATLLESWSAWRGELRTGDVSLFDSRCLHAGDANASPQRRVLFYCSFIREEHAPVSTRGTLLDSLRGGHALEDWREWLT